MQKDAWRGFAGTQWKEKVDVRDFIIQNYRPYEGDESFLSGPTERTKQVLEQVQALQREEIARGGVYDVDTKTVITPTAFGPGYVDKKRDLIVGLQTDAPLKRACNPFGGMRMVREACEAYGYHVSEEIERAFRYHKTHNDGVFDAYTPEIKRARHCGLITGLPDAYGRGRIIGDYRRVALYGVERLIWEKQQDRQGVGPKGAPGRANSRSRGADRPDCGAP